MILNKNEAILCDTSDEYCELIHSLIDEGYFCCTGDNLNTTDLALGVRWLPTHKFPACVALITQEIFDELAQDGVITRPGFDNDRGTVFDVRWYGGQSVLSMNVEDLL